MNQRDLELLSAYLDGELTVSDSARLESRLKNDPALVAVLNDLRAARTFLRKLPKRRAPRNFTLTRKMVGLNPPLPRSYPAFRFVTTIATLLFFFTFGINTLAPQLLQPIAIGGGGGAEQTDLFSSAPAMEAAPAEAPAATEPPLGVAGLDPQPTLTVPAEDAARIADTPAAKALEEGSVQVQSKPQAGREATFIPSVWLLIFAGIALIGTIFMLAMRQSSINRWK